MIWPQVFAVHIYLVQRTVWLSVQDRQGAGLQGKLFWSQLFLLPVKHSVFLPAPSHSSQGKNRMPRLLKLFLVWYHFDSSIFLSLAISNCGMCIYGTHARPWRSHTVHSVFFSFLFKKFLSRDQSPRGVSNFFTQGFSCYKSFIKKYNCSCPTKHLMLPGSRGVVVTHWLEADLRRAFYSIYGLLSYF